MHSANDNPLNETVAPQKTPTTSFRAKIIRMILSLLAIYLTICGMMVILENRIVYPAPGSIDLALNDPTIEEVWIDSFNTCDPIFTPIDLEDRSTKEKGAE